MLDQGLVLYRICGMSRLPGSVSSCDAFLNVFQPHGLKPEVICPCASSPEAMTVAIRRYVTLKTKLKTAPPAPHI